MVFNSFEFLVFLPIVFLLYWFVARGRRLQNVLIVLASYVFYGWWDWKFLFLIVLTSVCSYLSGRLIESYEGRRSVQRGVSAANIVLNLGILATFKYYNFFVDSFAEFSRWFGWSVDVVTLDVILPVGISFYTFQALSYTIDVYRRKLPATHDLIEFLAYISFFPQLVAGPIERATNLLPQFQRDREFDYARAVDGCRQMLWGLFKKVVVADNCAIAVNRIWASYDIMPGLALLLGAVLFAFQIYGDFSGYSDIAIGCSRLFGFDLKKNFDYPYFSRSVPEFWRRWHMSLMTWFRDYVYFPMGGSRCGKMKIIRNVLVVWFISGLWHGANWTFVCWGLFHGGVLAVYNLLGVKTKYEHPVAEGRILPSLKEFGQMALCFFLVVIGWVLFRSSSIDEAVGYFSAMGRNVFYSHSVMSCLRPFALVMLMVVVEWLQRDKEHALQLPANTVFKLRAVRWGVYYIILILILSLYVGGQSFIYFQF